MTSTQTVAITVTQAFAIRHTDVSDVTGIHTTEHLVGALRDMCTIFASVQLAHASAFFKLKRGVERFCIVIEGISFVIGF